MPRKRLTQSKMEKAVKAVATACGAAQVVIDPDGTVRILPFDGKKPTPVDKPAWVDL